MNKDQIFNFDKVFLQLKAFYDEISVMAKKSSDNPLNKFKLKFVNQNIKDANDILGEENKPFKEFTLFDEDDIPTNSDVVVIMSQYLKSFAKFYSENTVNRGTSGIFWKIEKGDDEEIEYVETKRLYVLERLYN